MMRLHAKSSIAAVLVCALLTSAVACAQQTMSNQDRQLFMEILRTAHSEVQKHYYDPKFGGLDWDARYRQFTDAMANARSRGQAFHLVGAYLAGLKDSHTYFIPPDRVNHLELGYQLSLVGDDCFVTQIRPKTDAESKLHIGDQVLTLNGYTVERSDFFDLLFAVQVLEPQQTLRLGLKSPDGSQRMADVDSIVIPGRMLIDLTPSSEFDRPDMERQIEMEEHLLRARLVEFGDVAILKLPEFFFDMDAVDRIMKRAGKDRALILDLRGNPGGSAETLKWVVGSLFDHDVKISDRLGRKPAKPLIAKAQKDAFAGKLIVLVDGGSASASELLARVVQLEHRGTILGDKTAGAVMESDVFAESSGVNTVVLYGFSVTAFDLVMADGKSLEKVGVTPDETILPTGADLAAGRDPVLARAAQLVGVKLDAAEAGKMFPFEWMPLKR